MLTFLRKSADEKLLVVCNFSGLAYEQFKVGVPSPGKYKEIFNSDKECYGGGGFINPRVKFSKPEKWDGKGDLIRINVAPLSVQIFNCIKPEVEKKKKK